MDGRKDVNICGKVRNTCEFVERTRKEIEKQNNNILEFICKNKSTKNGEYEIQEKLKEYDKLLCNYLDNVEEYMLGKVNNWEMGLLNIARGNIVRLKNLTIKEINKNLLDLDLRSIKYTKERMN